MARQFPVRPYNAVAVMEENPYKSPESAEPAPRGPQRSTSTLVQDGLRLLGSTVTAFSLFTFTWAVWGLLTTADYFANGSTLFIPTLGLAVIVGFLVGFRLSGRVWIVLLVAALLSLCFWIFVPDGWWSHGP